MFSTVLVSNVTQTFKFDLLISENTVFVLVFPGHKKVVFEVMTSVCMTTDPKTYDGSTLVHRQ